MSNELPILEVKGLRKQYPIKSGFRKLTTGYVKAVDDVDFSIKRGETLGLVGESGCGKTTLGRCIVRAVKATAGSVLYRLDDGEEVDFLEADRRRLKSLRKDIQMIFQDPYASLDPRMTVYDIIAEPLRVNKLGKEKQIEERVKYLSSVVGLNVSHLKRYPHAFSGGQRQRIGIARALAPNPKLVIADEPVSALDVSVQAQVLNLIEELQGLFDLTFLFVAHDLSVVEHISDRVAVMYFGKIVEIGVAEELFADPKHPYTAALRSAVPMPDPRKKMNRIVLQGEIPNPANPPSGCPFHPRCRFAKEICKTVPPLLRELTPSSSVSCHFGGELDLKVGE